MNKSGLIFLLCIANLFYSQNHIKLEIINDTIKKVSSFDQCNIFYVISNTSDHHYYLILDPKHFNEDPEYTVEPLFVGLPDYYLYSDNQLMAPGFSFGGHGNVQIDKEVKGNVKKKKDTCNFNVKCRLSKLIIHLEPHQKKIFRTTVDFPYYKGRSYDLKNSDSYFFEMRLTNPVEYTDAYKHLLPKNKGKYKLFTGTISSNKVPLIYKVYN